MTGEISYVVSWLAAFAVVGALWYVADRKVGIYLYRWIYDLSHEKGLPRETVKGFIYNQRARSKFTAATVLAVIQTAVAISRGGGNPVLEIVTFFAEIPAMLVGFYIGPFFFRMWERKDTILDKMDEFESGETTIAKELKSAGDKALHAVREAAQQIDVGVAAPASEPPPGAPKPPAQPEDPKKLMDKYLRRS